MLSSRDLVGIPLGADFKRRIVPFQECELNRARKEKITNACNCFKIKDLLLKQKKR
jgi:hypothetical protein